MRDCFTYVIAELGQRDLIQSWLSPADVWHGALQPCDSCRATGSRGNARKCRGWLLSFRGQQALWLRPVDLRARTIQPSVEGSFDLRRATRSRSWQTAPIASCNGVIQLHDPATGDVLTRQHLDLANPEQSGTVWHLQLGGVGSTDDVDWRKAVANLRWPSLPTDFMLLVELALFLFAWESWRELRAQPVWGEYVRAAEDLVLAHYRDALEGYWNHRTTQFSWLSAQCNLSGTMNPRPS